jgi:hypothetical protein
MTMFTVRVSNCTNCFFSVPKMLQKKSSVGHPISVSLLELMFDLLHGCYISNPFEKFRSPLACLLLLHF